MRWLMLAVLVASGAAQAQEAAVGQSWSVVGPKTISSGANAIEGAVGWPGLSVSYLHGLAARFNLGARFSFNYGVEGIVRYQVTPGIKLQVLTKFSLLESGRVSLGVTFEPGPLFHFYSTSTLVGFALPVGFRLGVAASSAVQLAILFDLPFWISFGAAASFNVPILTGVGVEFFLQSNLLLFLRLRMGPTIFARGGPAEFTLESAVGVGWRF
ncbi:MAG: hypothetical protein AB1938_03150 [Myxococcota bacterium]